MKIKVNGGFKLNGTVTPIANKNSIVAALPASILIKGKTVYKNVPKSTDVDKILSILRDLGAVVNDVDYNNLTVDCTNVKSWEVNSQSSNKFRGSIMFAGPLLARFGKAKIPLPGGCVLGKRSIAAHLDVFKGCGIKTEYGKDSVTFSVTRKLKNVRIWQLEASVTATENFAMFAAGTDGVFELIDAACEPHVSEVLTLLENMGAKISGVGSNKILITGTKELKGTTYTPGPDVIDIVGYITAAALTKGKILIKNANVPDIVDGVIQYLTKFNIKITESGKDLLVDGTKPLKIDLVNSGIPLAGDDLPKFSPRPWPGFPVDALPQIVALGCKLDGRILIQNWMYESGLEFSREILSMGGNVFMCDPQKIIVSGPAKLKNSEVFPPDVIQAIMALFLLALSDPVETTINNAQFLLRRYPNIIRDYTKLGAKIKIIES
ncbi:UDP-N-acetylglucosamine 1-carboxyvinyltransferase [candidate division WWE3 bacterium]|jgi:UDP-N-acetylglucosamine 1-carboxyvinyltransferase|uniref:UDP-N-acetylglucosamine 1-carboxyvinyltransferase n=1 Tax=candidate division WWE3 bacterium TaxID=2053526 RepID=A0A3A4ZDS5_UNCKA|nr:MAG: UDP-N-acetylglucosamine 1-carboxyvinyltransferase [candidate division WWE3 bacterium]